MRILLIEDDRSISAPLLERATAGGHSVLLASCLEDLCQLRDIGAFDLLALDLQFTGLDPLLYLQKLRSLADGAEVLLLGVDARNEQRARALGLGIRNFLPDPPDPADFFQRAAALVDSNRRPAAEETAAAPAPASASAATADAAPSDETPPHAEVAAFAKTDWSAGLGQRGRVLLVGSHKGGTGKSTTAIHLVAGLLYQGLRVASIDLDNPQLTLTRFIENRKAHCDAEGLRLPLPQHHALPRAEEQTDEVGRTVELLAKTHDAVVIDTPGGYSQAARAALAWADCAITPINDSFLDLDLLAVLDPESQALLHPGHYSKLIAEARGRRAQWQLGPLDWLVLRNRLSAIGARNKQQMNDALTRLAGQLGFRQAEGLGERVVYRERFLEGLTLFDLPARGTAGKGKDPDGTARQELRHLLARLLSPADAMGAPPPAQFGRSPRRNLAGHGIH
jgi:chromosome partitioning protein